MIGVLNTALLIVLIVLPVLSTIAAIILVSAARQRPPIRALTERAIVAVLGTVAGWIIAGLAANSLLQVVAIERPWSTLLVIAALILFTAPGPVFLVLYRLGYLRDDQ